MPDTYRSQLAFGFPLEGPGDLVRASGDIPPAQLTPLIGRTPEVAVAHQIGRPLRARSEESELLPQDPSLHRV